MIPMQRRASQWNFCWRMFYAAMLFLAGSSLFPQAMPNVIYGRWAVLFEAEGWALGLAGAAMLTISGIIINGRRRWSPLLRVMGLLIMFAMISALLVSAALFAPSGVVLWSFGGAFIWFPCLGHLRFSILDFVARWRDHGGA